MMVDYFARLHTHGIVLGHRVAAVRRACRCRNIPILALDDGASLGCVVDEGGIWIRPGCGASCDSYHPDHDKRL